MRMTSRVAVPLQDFSHILDGVRFSDRREPGGETRNFLDEPGGEASFVLTWRPVEAELGAGVVGGAVGVEVAFGLPGGGGRR